MIAGKDKTAAGVSARKHIRCPQKTGINMNMHEKRTGAVVTLIVGITAIVILAGLVAKFGVIDQYQRQTDAQTAYGKVHQQYQSMQEELTDYDKVLTEYRTYSMDWLTGADESDDRFVSVSRQKVLDLIETEMMTRGTVNSVRIYGDRVSISMTGMNLDEISQMVDVIEAQPIVAKAVLDLAETEKDKPASILSFSLNITLQREEAAEQ